MRDTRGGAHGITVNSFTSVSLDPPLILICIGHKATSLKHFRACDAFGINVLSEDQEALSRHFARTGHDRFERLEWRPGHTGAPLIPGVLAFMECAVRQCLTAGDHDIFIAEVVSMETHEGEPLIYYASRYRRLASFR